MGEAKRRKQLDPTWGTSSAYISFSTYDESVKFINTEHNGLSRFVVWNNEVYGLDKDGYAPLKQSSRYPLFKELLDDVYEGLKDLDNGVWTMSNKMKRWYYVPLCFSERVLISKFDSSALENISLDTPTTLLYPRAV